jgi:DNA-binding transcriptional ArsR family regulator
MLQQKDPAQKIELYLKQVRSGLRNLPEPQVADILQELRSHILERAQSGDALSDSATIAVARQSS